uniref:Uncharacterized protein n=1 Tax=Glossina palpalis gambiensis TaxID=67801 RepID=A0A1B0BEX3_9MUSC
MAPRYNRRKTRTHIHILSKRLTQNLHLRQLTVYLKIVTVPRVLSFLAADSLQWQLNEFDLRNKSQGSFCLNGDIIIILSHMKRFKKPSEYLAPYFIKYIRTEF